MAGTLYGFPFNEELFSYLWRNEPDPITTAFLNSGVMVQDGEIETQISQGSDIYTVPFYKLIGGEEDNYDGQTDINTTETTGSYQTGVVYGRAKGWRARDFILDYHKADPMAQIVAQVNSYVDKRRQSRLIGMVDALFGVTAPSDPTEEQTAWYTAFADHTTDLSSSTTTVTDDNKLGATTMGDAAVKACGDLAVGSFGLAIMHSTVAQNLAGTELLEFRKYTDIMGIERTLPITDINGYTVIVSDEVPVEDATESTAKKYTSFLLGNGFIRYAPAPVKMPVEPDRDPAKNGGEDILYIRYRETMLPNGFTYTKESTDGPSPTDAILATSSRYGLIYDPKCIPVAKIVSNG